MERVILHQSVLICDNYIWILLETGVYVLKPSLKQRVSRDSVEFDAFSIHC